MIDLESLIFSCFEYFWASKYNSRYAEVTSYDPEKHAAKVKIKPFDIETGWLPIQALHVGDGWGIVVGLSVGDQVKLTHNGADFEIAEVTARVHDDKSKPPEVKSGEILFKHKDAGQFFFDEKKNMTWTGANGQTIKTDKKGNTTLSLKVSNKKDADSNSPTYSISLEDQDGKKHNVNINKGGIAHKSDTKVAIDVGGKHQITVDKDNGITHKSDSKIHLHAPTIEHHGDLNVSGKVQAETFLEGSVSFNE